MFPLTVLLVTVAEPRMPAPYAALFPLTVLLVTVSVAPLLMPPPSPLAVFPLMVLPVTVTNPDWLSIPAPSPQFAAVVVLFPTTVLFVSVIVPPSLKIPPPRQAVLFGPMVLPVTVTIPRLKMPPPPEPEPNDVFPLTVLFVTVRFPLLLIPPPSLLAAGAVFPVMVLLLRVRVPSLRTPPLVLPVIVTPLIDTGSGPRESVAIPTWPPEILVDAAPVPSRLMLLLMLKPPGYEPLPVAARLIVSSRQAQERAKGMVWNGVPLVLGVVGQVAGLLPAGLTYQVTGWRAVS
jgi:hypothetical protein